VCQIPKTLKASLPISFESREGDKSTNVESAHFRRVRVKKKGGEDVRNEVTTTMTRRDYVLDGSFAPPRKIKAPKLDLKAILARFTHDVSIVEDDDRTDVLSHLLNQDTITPSFDDNENMTVDNVMC